MRSTTRSVLILCLILTGAAHAQWVEATIGIPDSLVGLRGPECLAYNQFNNTIQVAGSRGKMIVAIDGTTSRKVARIAADTASC